MKVLSLHKRSIYHPNFSEDFLFSYSLNKNILVTAVMDGCSTAIDSHFVSALYSKSLHKSCRMLPQMKEILDNFDIDEMALESIGDFIMNQLFEDLKKTKKLYFLKTEELLSTIVLSIYHKKNKSIAIQMSGDGLFAINEKVVEIDQNNMPNFMGYHLDASANKVLDNEIQRWNFDEVHDFAIATDGLCKFKKSQTDPSTLDEVGEAFLIEKPTSTQKTALFLEKKFNAYLEAGFLPHDDIALIRVVN